MHKCKALIPNSCLDNFGPYILADCVNLFRPLPSLRYKANCNQPNANSTNIKAGSINNLFIINVRQLYTLNVAECKIHIHILYFHVYVYSVHNMLLGVRAHILVNFYHPHALNWIRYSVHRKYCDALKWADDEPFKNLFCSVNR